MKLIVNADDFGFSPGQNYGIIDAFENGIVRSTSLLAVGGAVEQAVELARAHPKLGIGVHLSLDLGRPVLAPELIPSLIGPEGVFRRPSFDSSLELNIMELEQEWRAQIEFVLAQGLKPTHLDGHHHFHLHPQLFALSCKLARTYELALRPLPLGWPSQDYAELTTVRHPDTCVTDFYDDGVEESFFTEFFTKYPYLRDEIVEVMCHPAYVDDVIATRSSYNFPRVKELQILKSPRVREWVEIENVQLVNYGIL